MSKPPYPGFPSYPPGDPRNALWEERLKAYNATVELMNKRLELKIARSVIVILLLIIVYHWRTMLCMAITN